MLKLNVHASPLDSCCYPNDTEWRRVLKANHVMVIERGTVLPCNVVHLSDVLYVLYVLLAADSSDVVEQPETNCVFSPSGSSACLDRLFNRP